MVGLEITVTPPHPPPLKDEEAPSTSWEILVKQRCGPALVKMICWFAAFSETIAIAASLAPSCSTSEIILRVLDGKGHVDAIHVSPLCVMGATLSIFGGITRYACYRELGSLFTFEMSIKREHRLVTTGPYSIARHPGYTGVLCTVIGIVIIHTAPGSWARECEALCSLVGMAVMFTYLALTGLISIGLLRRMEKEDEALRQMFKEEWDEWAKRVPWKLVPGMY
ncbi:hypothetical protein V5O48_006456 [Marasmius crinis-equi]|uniref:Protein-S-isoprenylcysteine O-methyltransferase n=1 Tax=Marasmius crinis-equi TaxID=585013 RepID=A0ABR3FJD4_9AGAR